MKLGALAAIVIVLAHPAAGQTARGNDDGQQDLFAMYCVGVLDATAEKLKTTPRSCLHNESVDSCLDKRAVIDGAIADARYRRERFFSFLLRRFAAGMTQPEGTSTHYREKGLADFKTCQEARDRDFRRTSAGCAKFCTGEVPSPQCRQCYEAAEPAVCQSVSRCSDTSLLPM